MVTNDESDYLPDIYMTDIMNQQMINIGLMKIRTPDHQIN